MTSKPGPKMGLGFFLTIKHRNMKKLFTLIMMAGLALSASAQLADGFYRVKNVSSGRYIVMYDGYVFKNTATGSVNLKALQTVEDWGTVCSHMGSVWYMKNIGGVQYDMYCQSSSLGSKGNFYPSLLAIGGNYQIYGTYEGFTKYLNDESNEDGGGYVSITGTRPDWSFIPLGGDNYVGIEPETNADGYYWATFMSGFPFKLGSGMKAYYVSGVSNSGFAMKEMGDEIPAKVPVLIRLNGGSPSDNIITMQTSNGASSPSGNKLYGNWYSTTLGGNHREYNLENDDSYRILGNADGRLAFVKATEDRLVLGAYIEHNRGILVVGEGANDALIESTSGIESIVQDNTEKGIYTITGQKVPEGTTPRPGIYIKNGKKMIIK